MSRQARRKRSRRQERRADVRRIQGRRLPWFGVAAAVVVLAFVGSLVYHFVPKVVDRSEAERFTPSGENADPSANIDGIVKMDYAAGQHVMAPQRVGYDTSPPYGGPHDQYWATCTGTVYSSPIRVENAVHSLEHGAVWITYDPERIGSDIETLTDKVDGQPYTMLSPFPGSSAPISLQAWGRQLQVYDAQDKRITQFIAALRQNSNTSPEAGASCSTIPGGFDPSAPPPMDQTAPGPDALPMPVGEGSDPAQIPLPGSGGTDGGK